MTDAITDEQVERFLVAYGQSLERFDANRAAALWGLPGMILSDQFAGTLDSRERMAQGLSQSYPLYRQLGLGGVRFELLAREDLTARITRLRVKWLFDDVEGNELADGTYEYVVRADRDGLHVYFAADIDAGAKLAALADRLGVAMS